MSLDHSHHPPTRPVPTIHHDRPPRPRLAIPTTLELALPAIPTTLELALPAIPTTLDPGLMPASGSGYSGTPLVRKLGLKAGMRVRLLDAPPGYWAVLGEEPASLDVESVGDDERADFTHLFATETARLDELLARARAGMTESGLVWVSWPKKASGVPTEVGRAEVMSAGKAAGLVDVKVAAVDEVWSGLKFVIPVAERSSSPRPEGRK